MTWFRNYLISVTAAALLAAVLRRAAPAGSSSKIVRLASGLLVIAAAFGPLLALDLPQAAEELARSGFSDPLSTTGVDAAGNKLLAELISDAAESYIWDKAQALGLDAEVTVTTQLDETYPVPYEVTIRAAPTAAQRQSLAASIAEDLGVPEERQVWKPRDSG